MNTNTFDEYKNELSLINQSLADLLTRAAANPDFNVGSLRECEKACFDIEKQISEDTLRIAVVGTVKSGKSTFVNSLFQGDYLKRGAGVITSVVTRAVKGKSLRAKLDFKSWAEVNEDIQNAAGLVPDLNADSENAFDIRLGSDRSGLEEAVERFDKKTMGAGGTRNEGASLISSYLKGYKRAEKILSSESLSLIREKERFEEHREFVSDDSLAVYLKDVNLEIDSGKVDEDMEIADCQGSDSPNPLHLVMVQDYLRTSHLILYLISGRTGLREADVKFLSVIGKMEMMDRILFIVNFDISEHESESELVKLLDKTRDELGMIKPDPEIFALSALCNLFESQSEKLSTKDAMRYEQWRIEETLASYSDRETERFELYFRNKLAKEHTYLLLKNLFCRIEAVTAGLSHRIGVHMKVLAGGPNGRDLVFDRMKSHRKKLDRVESMVQRAIDGAVAEIKKELTKDLDSFFDPRSGDIMGKTVGFIKNHRVDLRKIETGLENQGFPEKLNRVFLDFKHSLDRFMAETVTPEVMGFVRKEEKKIWEGIEMVAGTSDAVFRDAIAEYNRMLDDCDLPRIPDMFALTSFLDPESMKAVTHVSLPQAGEFMRYNMKIKTEALMSFGFSRFLKLVGRLIKRPVRYGNETRAIEKAVERMKKEAEKAIVFHFKNYKENLKYQYILKLADTAADNCRAAFLDRFRACRADLSDLHELLGNPDAGTNGAMKIFDEMETALAAIAEQIRTLKLKMESSMNSEPIP